MTNKITTTPTPRRAPRLVAIWNDIRYAQVRLDQVNRPWLSDVRRNRSV